MATIGVALDSGYSLKEAVELSTWTAAAVVAELGTAIVTPQKVIDFVASHT